MDIKWILIILGYVVGGIYIIYQIICNVRSLIKDWKILRGRDRILSTLWIAFIICCFCIVYIAIMPNHIKQFLSSFV
jgi:hypothetical protein